MSQVSSKKVIPTTRPVRKELLWGHLPRPAEGIEPFSGLVCVDKDYGVTSHDVVGAVRRLAGTRKVGHAGTLDPMATGVLCVGIGRATKLLQYVTGTSKEYKATIRFGIETSTEDAQGDILACHDASLLTIEDIDREISHFTGRIMQVPSSVSALKVQGKRAYELVREGKEVALKAREIEVSFFQRCGNIRYESVAGITVADVDVRVECSSGTYIRALARDLGTALGVGAHLIALRRTRVGAWNQKDCLTVAELAERVRAGDPLPHISLAVLCMQLFDVIEVSDDEAGRLQHGQFIDMRDLSGVTVAFSRGTPIALLQEHKGRLKPSLVFSRVQADRK